MELTVPPRETARVGLRALKMVASADGEFRQVERSLIGAVQAHVLGTDFDVDALEPIAPEEVAAAVTDPVFRRRIVSGCSLLVLIDGDADERERALLGELQRALGVDEKVGKTIERFARGQMRRLRLDVARRFVGFDRLKKTIRDDGFLALFRTLRDALRRSEDAALAERYRALADLPDGTLGREYLRFMRDNGFALPGEVDAAPELISFHDATHVLAGYGTSAEEEAQIAAFHGGTHGADPFGMLLFAVMQFQLEVQITPANPGFRDTVDPDLLMQAFMRGTRVRGDMIRDWDPRAHWERPVADLRAEWNVEPR